MRANYGEVYIEFTVTVVRANITVAAGLSITDTYKKVDLAFIQEMVGSLDGVTIYDETNGQNLTYTLNGTVATLTNYTGSVGYMIWAFNTPGISVKTEVMHATHRIASKKDFALLGKDWREATLGNVTSTIVYSNGTDNWMVALAADLDFTGDANVTNDVLFGSNAAADGYVAVFNGTFDGRGYAIKNAAFNNGFICNLGDTGVIRNTALINCKPLNGGGVLGNYGRGTVDNCYVEGTLSGATQAGAYYYSSGKMLRVKNTVFKLIGTGQQGVVTTQAAAASEPNIENVYCISTSVNKIWGNDATGGAGVIYANASAWANDIGSLPVGYSSFWKMTDGGLMFGANRVLSW